MTDDDLIVFYQILLKQTKEDLCLLNLKYLIEINLLNEEVDRLRINNKIGEKRESDEDKAFLLFINLLVKNKKRPSLQEWNVIVGSKEQKWKYESLKVKDKEELLENGLTKSRAKGWYYKYSKAIELFLKQKLGSQL